jgi:hypothetical protein
MARGLILGIGESRVLLVSKSTGLVGKVGRMVRRKLLDRGFCLALISSDWTFDLSVATYQSRISGGRR